MAYEKRLIEDSLPLEAISKQSAREKSIRHGHISTLHIWWARRPLAAMRAAIFASLIPAPKTEEEREYLHDLITDIVDWDAVKKGNSPRVLEARELIRKHYPDAPPKVLDPFMGGGSTGLEALRLGCEAHGVELNPVAYLIELCTLVYPQKYGQPVTIVPEDYEGTLEQAELDLPGLETPPTQIRMDMPGGKPYVVQNPLAEDVRRWGEWVLEETRKEIGHLYEDPEGHTIVGYIWARTAKCPNPACGAEMPMLRQTWLANKKNKKVALRMNVDRKAKEISFEVVEGDAIDFDPTDMTMKRGTIVCPICGNSPPKGFLGEEGRAKRLGERMLAVVYRKEGKIGKYYRVATKRDMDLFEKARKRLNCVLAENPDALPSEPTPDRRSRSVSIQVYGLMVWSDLFNPRQSLMLTVLTNRIDRIYKSIRTETGDSEYATAVVSLLACAIDRMVDKASTLALWYVAGEKIQHTFGRQALPMVWDYVEVNPFSGATGDWASAVVWVVRAIEHCSLAADSVAHLKRGDASRLNISHTSMDAVITDPPYYDSVTYAELSDFFYVWLKRSIGEYHGDIFATPLTPKTPEIIQARARHPDLNAAKQFYEEKMTEAFSQGRSVLCDDGIVVVVFAHKSTSAWETLINSLLSAGLVVTASWPLHTELSNRQNAQGTASLASSIFIVCRNRISDEDGFIDDVHHELRERIAERLTFFWGQGIRGADFFISAIGPAVEVFGRYSRVRKLTGEDVGVAELLDLVQEMVADYALRQVLNGRYQLGAVDAPTRFYVMYRWSYNKQKLPFDDARRLAQALGAEVDDLIGRYRIVKKRGATVTMPDASGRVDDEHLGEPARDGSAAPVIDVLHRALRIWQGGDRQALVEFLETHAASRGDAVSVVAQAIASVLPPQDEERRMLENFLQGSENLPAALYRGKLI